MIKIDNLNQVISMSSMSKLITYTDKDHENVGYDFKF